MTTPRDFSLPPRSLWQTLIVWPLRLLRWAIGATMVVFLVAPMLLDAFNAQRGNAAVEFAYSGRTYLRDTVGPEIRKVFPTKFAGKDRTDWVALLGLFLAYMAIGSIVWRIDRAMDMRAVRKTAARWKSEMQVPSQSKIASVLDAKLQELQSGNSKLSHQELLKVFAETKRKLDAMGRDLAFLSVDVVGSTQMKVQEEPAAIQHDFLEYRKLVERVFARSRMLKAAWTPDGVMACFPNVNDAVQAGQDIIRELIVFNKSVKLMRTDFAVRCGVNAGFVYFDESTPMETMSDRVIDVAGHMQKHADPNTVLVARKIIEPLRQLEEFTHTTQVVDGYEASVWRETA
jgi:class 3 adenylate cyclase